MNVSDLQLRQFIDEVFMRYDYNKSGTLNLPELHIFLTELFSLTGMKKTFSYEEACGALQTMDANRDGQISKFELYNLYRHMTQPGYQPVTVSFSNFRYGGLGMSPGIGMGMGMGMGLPGMTVGPSMMPFGASYNGSYMGYGGMTGYGGRNMNGGW
jgi:hypothetical protein